MHIYISILIKLMQTLPALKINCESRQVDSYSDTVTQIQYVKREHNIHVNVYNFDALCYFMIEPSFLQ